jgi:hypothetical protein
VDKVVEAVAAAHQIPRLDRAEVRSAFERRFTAERMTEDYLAIYRGLSGVRRDAAGMRRSSGRGSIGLHAVA